MNRWLIALVGLLFSAAVHAATVVQAESTEEFFGDPVTVTLSAVTSGNAVVQVFQIEDSSQPVVAVSDNQSNVYSLDTTSEGVPGETNDIFFYSETNITNGPTQTSADITAAMFGNPAAFELSGVDSADPVDTTASNSGTGSAPSVSFTTGAANSLGIAILSTAAAVTVSDADGWTAETPGGAYPVNQTFFYLEDLGAAGAKTLDLTLGGSTNWRLTVVAYNNAGGGGPSANLPAISNHLKRIKR